MNTMKLLYDVAKTMKAKETFTGILTAKVQKDNDTVFSFRNDFEKSTSGATKAKISTEVNLDGKKLQHESSTECEMPHRPHHWHMFRHMHHGHHAGCCGIKDKFAKLSCVFGILSSLKVEEKDEGHAVISLACSDIPEEIKTHIREKINHGAQCHPHHGCMGELLALQSCNGTLTVTVNAKREVEKVVVDLAGTQQDVENGEHIVKANAELQLVW